MRRALLLAGTIAVLFVLGVAGLRRVDAAGTTLAHVYGIFQLFWMEGDWTKDMAVIPWEVQVVRFLAPLTFIATVVLVFVQDARLALANAQIRLFSGHVVVVGLNDLSLPLIRSSARTNRRVVVLERNADNRRIDECRKLGVRVVVGDWLAERNLLRVGVEKSSHVVALADSDSTNVEIMLLTKRLLSRLAARSPLRFHLHLRDTKLAQELEEYPKIFDEYGRVEVNFFNVDERSARSLFLDYPFELYADALRLKRVHFALFGFNDPAEQLILKAARTAHYATLELPRVSVFAPDPDAARREFLARNPGVNHAVEIDFHPLAPGGRLYFEQDQTPALKSVSAYVLCMPDDQESLKLALGLRRALKLRKGENGPVFVRMQSSQGLAQLLEGVDVEAEEPDGIFPFGMLDDVLDVEGVVDNEQDILAREMHESYIAQAQTVYNVKRPSQNPWSNLPERYRNDNREQADHVAIKLRAMGYRRVARGTDAFSAAEIEVLAKMEKNRYRASRYSKGWRPGPRNDLAKLDVSAFDDDIAWDRERVSELPGMLAERLGQGISREIIIGVSGHRLHKLDLGSADLRRACIATLNAIRDEHADASFIIMSALAEGGDRFVADLAMDVLDADLWAPLPLPFELYTRDFALTDGSREEFERFVARSRYYFEMPLVFGEFAELEEQGEGDNVKRARQYALAGAYIVQRCHELLAIWDGKPAAGIGGTGDIVEWRMNGVPETFAYPSALFPAVAATRPFVVPPEPGAGFVPRRLETA